MRKLLAGMTLVAALSVAAPPAHAQFSPGTHCDQVCQASRTVNQMVADAVKHPVVVVSDKAYGPVREIYAVLRDAVGQLVPQVGPITPPCPPISGC